MAANEIASAYVKIIPSAKGLKQSLSSEIGGDVKSAGKESGTSMGTSLVGALKGVVAAAGIGVAVKSSLDAGGAIQQSFGGLDTLYGKASSAAKDYAQDAYKAGISANDYAEQAVSFGAALKSAFGGDTKKAAEAANTAIMDMTDNAAKMGTDIESIQNAYQGFAKSNWSMLDNLKLGYGGSQKEMKRLLEDAEKLSGKKYDIGNLGDVYEAIHVIQKDLGLTGVAAEEANGTFTGSFGSMKAAAENLMASLSADEMDVTPQMSALVSTASTFFFGNFLPMIGNIAAAIPEAVGTLITTAGPIISEKAGELIAKIGEFFAGDGLAQMTENAKTLIDGLISGVNDNLPFIVSSGAEMVSNFITGALNNLPNITGLAFSLITSLGTSIIQNLPTIITAGFSIATSFVRGILQNLPTILQQGFTMVTQLVTGVRNNFPQIVTAAANGLAQFVRGIVTNLPQVFSTGIQLLGRLAAGIVSAIGQIPAACSRIISSIKSSFSSIDWASVGSNIISGIVSGITGAAGALFGALKNLASSALSSAKSALEIKSPSRKFKREVGSMIVAGWAQGISENGSMVTSAVSGIANESYKLDFGSVSTSGSVSSRTSNARVIQLLEVIADKDTTVRIGNREFTRSLEDVGVVFA